MSATLQRDHWNGMTKSNSLTKPQRLMLGAAIQLLRQYTVEAERYKVERAAITYGHRRGVNRKVLEANTITDAVSLVLSRVCGLCRI